MSRKRRSSTTTAITVTHPDTAITKHANGFRHCDGWEQLKTWALNGREVLSLSELGLSRCVEPAVVDLDREMSA